MIKNRRPLLLMIVTHALVKMITAGLPTTSNSRSILNAWLSRLKEHVWYTILPNLNEMHTSMSFGMGKIFDNLLSILVDLGYISYRENRLFIIKKRWQNLNCEFPDLNHFHFTSYRIPGSLQTGYACKKYLPPSALYYKSNPKT